MATFIMAQAIGTGSLGDFYTLSLHAWQTSETHVRGAIHTRFGKKFEAPSYAIFSASRGSFIQQEEYGIVDDDGILELT